ncbi:DUF2442 domain-containing protein [Kaistia dalseonensis]|uniref:DUF2442 domain-containing protein n=1 Tax=Kaistia dalseonensis TaxID=410840 RepID=A0ABU0H5Q3_9HYPH|nr:DUF2442 domain-containing protein [Kaistia dalseonensis]MCX5495052.1 DUF2442 domain-containing protein [Kaistia dalseonensis]MDQ0437634.1 hypothetical protein [Kaistia dalseonensis]
MTPPAIKPDPRAIDAFVTEDMILVSLADGRELSVPLAWSEKLLASSEAERANWQLVGTGEALRWPDVDEEIAVVSLMRVA